MLGVERRLCVCCWLFAASSSNSLSGIGATILLNKARCLYSTERLLLFSGKSKAVDSMLLALELKSGVSAAACTGPGCLGDGPKFLLEPSDLLPDREAT